MGHPSDSERSFANGGLDLIVRSGTIVDGTGRAPIVDGVVVVRDGRIADVGPRASVAIPPDAPTVDISGKTVIPGLWDMHTHVTQIEWAPAPGRLPRPHAGCCSRC